MRATSVVVRPIGGKAWQVQNLKINVNLPMPKPAAAAPAPPS